jgi:nicotinamide-nucleotide amidase
MSPLNEGQAGVPRGAEVLPNANGTAPGLWLEHEGVTYVCLPGPPREFEPFVDSVVIPRLIARCSGPKRLHVTFRTVGIGESVLAHRLEHIAATLLAHDVAYLPHFGCVDVRVTFDGRDAGADTRDLKAIRAALRDAAGAALFAEGEESLDQATGAALRGRGWSVATAESCTAGRIASRLIAPAGASDYVRGGVVAYANDAKTALLDVPAEMIARSGAVSREVAIAMARGARTRLGADVAISSTGIAGPGGERPGKPVGLVFLAASSPDGDVIEEHRFAGSRQEITARATLLGVDLVRRVALRQATE